MKRLTEKPSAIIFDMDGVIVDSMPYHFLAWYEALKPYGIRVSCFDVYTKEGERWDRTLRGLFKSSGITPSPATLKAVFKQRQRIFKKYFKRYLFTGAAEFIFCLKDKGYRLALVTGTPTAEIQRILPKKLRRAFDCIVAGDHVKKGKPHPEPYLLAARGLGLAPGACVVVENAPFGIESAKRAGMFCVAVTTSLPKEYLARADMVVSRLEEIPGIIERSCLLRRKTR